MFRPFGKNCRDFRVSRSPTTRQSYLFLWPTLRNCTATGQSMFHDSARNPMAGGA
jgi:hypothetical protein